MTVNAAPGSSSTGHPSHSSWPDPPPGARLSETADDLLAENGGPHAVARQHDRDGAPCISTGACLGELVYA
jgi:hypothetical protein